MWLLLLRVMPCTRNALFTMVPFKHCRKNVLWIYTANHYGLAKGSKGTIANRAFVFTPTDSFKSAISIIHFLVERNWVFATNSSFLIPLSVQLDDINLRYLKQRLFNIPEAGFKEFEPRLKFMPRLKYGGFHLKLYSMFKDLSRHSIETGFWRIWDAAQIHWIRTLNSEFEISKVYDRKSEFFLEKAQSKT